MTQRKDVILRPRIYRPNLFDSAFCVVSQRFSLQRLCQYGWPADC